MSVMYIMIPAAFFLAGMAVMGFIWAAKRGQYEDLDSAAHRAVLDDEDHPAA